MPRSKILLVGLSVIPAAILATGHSSLGETKGDECRAKPDGSSPAGLHWYYRVDRANNRHCWYLHEQGMRVHSLVSPTLRSSDKRNDTVAEQVREAPPPVTSIEQPDYEQSATTTEPSSADFTARWVDLPRSVDLNARDLIAGGNGYAVEQRAEHQQEQLPAALANVSAINEEAPKNAEAKTNFGSISLAGAVILTLVLMSEALIRFARTIGWRLLRVRPRAEWHLESPQQGTVEPRAAEADAVSRTQAGVSELQRLLQRADTGLRPPQSFAPSRSVHRHQHANRARSHSTFGRLKSQSFSGMTWAPL